MLERRQAEDALISKAVKDDAFRKALIADPKTVIGKEYGVEIPANVDIKVMEETADTYYLVLPAPVTSELKDEELEAVVGGKEKDPPATTEGGGGCGCLCKTTTVKTVGEDCVSK